MRKLLVVALVAAALLVPNTAHAAKARHAARKLVHFTNVTRVEHGLHALHASRRLNRLAMQHTRAMVRQDALFHRSRIPHCQTWGENVGVGTTAWGLHRAFMRSSSHRANVLDRRFRHIGIGAIRHHGELWVTVELCT